MFELINQFFEKIYVITLDRNKKRQELIKKKFKNLEFSFFDGYDGQELDLKQLADDNVYDKKAFIEKRWDQTEPSPNKIGCALSHISVCKDIINNNYKNALILEDDVCTIKKNLKYLEKSLKELPDDWELVYLGYFQNERMPFSFRLKLYTYYPIFNMLVKAKYNLKELKAHFPREFSKHLQYAGRHYGGHAYGISKKGAQKYINLQSPIIQENDHTLGELCYKELAKSFILKNKIFIQNPDLESSIGSRV